MLFLCCFIDFICLAYASSNFWPQDWHRHVDLVQPSWSSKDLAVAPCFHGVENYRTMIFLLDFGPIMLYIYIHLLHLFAESWQFLKSTAPVFLQDELLLPKRVNVLHVSWERTLTWPGAFGRPRHEEPEADEADSRLKQMKGATAMKGGCVPDLVATLHNYW